MDWIRISGGAQQFPARDLLMSVRGLSTFSAHTTLLSDTELQLRACLARLNLLTELNQLHLVELKLLRASLGMGEQDIHFDVAHYPDADQRISVIFYCVDTLSTAIPISDTATMRPVFIDRNTATPQQKQASAESLCSRNNFLSVPVTAGQMLSFRTTVAHYGVKNTHDSDRVVLFALFSPLHGSGQDAWQRYPLGKSGI
jgi:hypothetical protein